MQRAGHFGRLAFCFQQIIRNELSRFDDLSLTVIGNGKDDKCFRLLNPSWAADAVYYDFSRTWPPSIDLDAKLFPPCRVRPLASANLESKPLISLPARCF